MAAERTTVVEIRVDLIEALRELYPGRSDREILEGIVREYLADHRRTTRDDAMLQALAAAPLDDEGSTEEQDRSAREATAEYHRGESIGPDQLKRELGLD